MTVIEFFDKTSIENILSALLCQPERVVFVGSSSSKMRRYIKNYTTVLGKRYIEVDMDYKSIKKNDLQHIFDTLSKLVEKYDDCVFNLDGGEDLCLVALGMLLQKYPGRFQMHRFNISNNTIIDCDADGEDQLRAPIAIGVEENINIYGGRVIYYEENPLGTYRWVMNEEFCQDIRAMWRICCASPRQWNYVITHLDQLRNIYCKKDALNVFLSTSALISSATESEVEQIKLILGLLSGFGIIADYVDGDDGISFRYKNHQIFQCLKHAGTLLELYTAVVARAQFKDDERIYQDVLTGVMIGWNTEPGKKEVTNEVDVVMMNGAVPVFISCKNGDMEKEELFKLYTVARNFGGPYARMALVASSLHELGPKGEHICLRAAELGIQVVDDVDNIEEAEFGEILGNLPSGTQKRVAYTQQK